MVHTAGEKKARRQVEAQEESVTNEAHGEVKSVGDGDIFGVLQAKFFTQIGKILQVFLFVRAT